MIQSATRRPALALTLAILFAAPAFAQSGVTGTDPCPKGTVCTTGPKTAVTTTKPTTPSSTSATTSTSDTSAAMQALLSFLGLS